MFIMLSGLLRRWRPSGRIGNHVTVIEWRDDGLLALRVNLPSNGQPELLDARLIACAPDQRDTCIARLLKQGWFTGGRNIVMLGIRQRQMAMLPRPVVPDAELVEAARWQLQGALDYPPEEAVIDVLRLGQDEPPARQQLAVFAVRRSELARWLGPLAASKISIEAVEVADCAQRNLAALHPSKGQAVAMLSLREDSIVFSVTRGGEVLVSRSFDAANVVNGVATEHAAEIGALAERVGLQLQRMLDTLERRSAAMAHPLADSGAGPSAAHRAAHPMRRAHWPARDAAGPGRACRVPTGREASVDAAAAATNGDFFHLLGAALRPAPTVVAA